MQFICYLKRTEKTKQKACLNIFIRYFHRCCRFGMLFFCLFFVVSPPVSSNEVIIHPSAEKALSLNTLRSIYSMRLQTWPDGTGITVFILDPADDEHRNFCLEILNIFPYQLQRVWDVLVFSGTGQSPVIVESEEEMISKVSSIPGSIGYVVKSEVPINVKKIKIK